LNLSPFSLDLLFQLFIVISLLSELDTTAGMLLISIVLIVLKSELNIYSESSEMIDNYFFNIDVFKCVRVIDKLSLVFNSVLIFLEGGGSSSVGPRTHIIDSFGLNSSTDQTAHKSNSMGSTSINGDILRLFLSLQ
jgi:hypothetical protein